MKNGRLGRRMTARSEPLILFALWGEMYYTGEKDDYRRNKMVTGVIKNKIDKIWTDLWAGGITNPLTVIEQLTYLMFIRSLDEKELETEELESISGEKLDKIFPQYPAGQSMRWSRLKNRDPRDIYDIISQRVFPAIFAEISIRISAKKPVQLPAEFGND